MIRPWRLADVITALNGMGIRGKEIIDALDREGAGRRRIHLFFAFFSRDEKESVRCALVRVVSENENCGLYITITIKTPLFQNAFISF